jgi:thiol-disulfide isomerase/thioredoxin
MRWSLRWLLACLLVSTLSLSGCDSGKAPNIAVHNLINAEQTINLAQPNKPTLVVFWATSCPSCIQEIPSLIQLQKDYGEQINIIGVAMSYDEPSTLHNFVLQRHLPYFVTHDSDQRIAQGFGNIFVTPTNILLSATGEITWKNVGTPDIGVLKERINILLPTN